MLLCRPINSAKAGFPAADSWVHSQVDVVVNSFGYSLSSSEQDGHDQCMRETDFDAIDESISCTLENSKVVM